jgi:hypothetical protein
MITFEALPQIGTTIRIDGQIYEMTGSVDYVTKDGRDFKLACWKSACPDCSEPFEVKTPLKFNSPNRRCDDCKTGMPVSGRRRKRLKISIVPPQS